MNRAYFEILATLSPGEWVQIGDEFHTARTVVKYGFEDYKRYISSLLSYGLIERKDYSYPVFCNRTMLRITKKGLNALDYYEPLFYKGTLDAGDYLDSDFVGR